MDDRRFTLAASQQFVPAFPAPAGAGGPTPAARQPLPKQLTAAIKGCASLERLTQLYLAHQAVLNPIHVAAMITKLPKLEAATAAGGGGSGDLPWLLSAASAQQVQLRQLLQQLLARLKLHGCSDHSPRGVANIVWALAKLQCAPDAELRAMLLDRFCAELGAAVPQDISNVLWGVAKLTKEHSAVLPSSPGSSQGGLAGAQLQRALAGGSSSNTPLPQPSAGCSVQLGSSALSAQDVSTASLADEPSAVVLAASGPLLQQAQVKLLLQQLCQKLPAASVQTISNSLWAVVVLQQEHQWCMCGCLPEVHALLTALCEQPQQALPGHIQPIIRCMSQLATACSGHAGDAWLRWQPPLLRRLLDYLCGQAEQLEMHHVSSVLRDVAQVVCLHLLLAKQLRDPTGQLPDAAAGLQHDSQGPAGLVAARNAPPSPSSCSSTGGLPGSSSTAPPSSSDAQGGSSMCGVSHSSSAASYSSMLGPSAGLPALPGAPAGGAVALCGDEEADGVLIRLATAGGPQDASSTVVALAMLQPYLLQLGLQAGVAGLCSLLPPAALPNLGPEVGQKLLAAASQQGVPAACSPLACTTPTPARGSPNGSSGSGSDLDSPGGAFLGLGLPSLPVTSGFAASLFAHPGDALPMAPVPLALAGSSSGSSGSGSGVTSPTEAAAAAVGAGGFRVPDAGPLLPGALEGGAAAASGSHPGHGGNLGHGAQRAAAAGQQGGVPGATEVPLVAAAAAAGAAAAAPGGDGAAAAAAPAPADTQEEAAARQLTHNIAYADSVFQLADIFTAHAAVMDMIHITACITRLSKVLGTSPSPAAQAAASSLLPMLGAKLQAVLPHANARGIANVLWGYGRLRNLPQSDLLPPLLEAFLRQLHNAACRDSAVVLWSLARLAEGQGGPQAVGVQPALLRRLGRDVLQQLAVASRNTSRQDQQQAAAADAGSRPARKGEVAEGPEPSAPPSSRDVSNSLMALARLGFTPEDDSGAGSSTSTAAPAAADAKPAGTPTAGQQAQDAAASLAGAVEGLSLNPAAQGAPAAGDAGAAASQQAGDAGGGSGVARLTLPLSAVQAVVEYLLTIAATAKTLDLQETATALKQLGLRDLQASVAAAIVAHHGSAHAGAGPGHGGGVGLHYMHLGAQAQGASYGLLRGGGGPHALPGLQGGRQAGLHPGAGQPLGGLLQHQQQRRQQLAGPTFGAGWMPAHSAAAVGGALDSGGMLRGPGAGAGLLHMQGAAGPHHHHHQQYMLSMPAVGGAGRQAVGGVASLTAGMAAPAGYSGSPGSFDAQGGAYGGAYGAGQQQSMLMAALQPQQQAAMYMPSAGVGGMQYMLVPQQQQQQQQQLGGYLMQQQQQQQGELSGLQQQPGIAGAGGQQQAGGQYLMLPSSSPAYYIAGAGAEPAAPASSWIPAGPSGAGAQLMMQGQGMLGGYGAQGGAAAGASMYPASAGVLSAGQEYGGGMLGPAYALGAAGRADAFLGGQQQQQQLQVLQQQVPGLYQAAQQDASGGMLMQPHVPGMYSAVAGQAQQPPPPPQQQQQQQYAVVDPTTGLYQFQS